MARYKVTLVPEERELLLATVGKGKGSAQMIRRANILLAVDRGEHGSLCMTDEEAAAAYYTTSRTIYETKRAFVEEGLEKALGRKSREEPSRRKVDGATEARIVALTCSDPPVGHARWSLRLLADTIVAEEILPSISHVAVRDILKKTNSSHGYTASGASPNAPAST
jgi:transposase